ncbi:Cna B-type domain-containing protein [Enterococcus sulfureus]
MKRLNAIWIVSFFMGIIFFASTSNIKADDFIENFPPISGVKANEFLKKGTWVDDKVTLNNFSNLNDLTNLEVIRDENSFEYFCLRRYMPYPSSDTNYFVDPNALWVDKNDSTIPANQYSKIEKENKAAVSWLLSNYYLSVKENQPSLLTSFEKANMQTKYAATQLVIWTFTNPRTLNNESYPRTINTNQITKDLINEANKHKNDDTDYQKAYKTLEESKIYLGSITEKEEEADNYNFSIDVQAEGFDDIISLKGSEQNIGLQLKFYEKDSTKEIDITDKINYTISPIDLKGPTIARIDFKVPKKYIDNKNSGTLTIKSDFQVETINSYSAYYRNTRGYQPIGARKKMSKNMTDFKKIDLADYTIFKVSKIWNDSNNQDGLRPEKIYVKLFRNDTLYKDGDMQILSEQNQWTGYWKNLPIKDEKGNIYKYTVKEFFDDGKGNLIETLHGYEADIQYPDEKEGTIAFITNTHILETTSLNGKKTWLDDNKNRPSRIIVNLLADGNKVDSQEVNSQNDWSYSFEDLPKNKNGKEISYTVKEENIPGYESHIDGNNLINIQLIELKGEKKWFDDNRIDRPMQIKVHLYRKIKNDTSPAIDMNQTQIATAETNWKYEFKDLPKYDISGKEYEYSIKEENVPGYESHVDGTNLINIELIGLEGEKKWFDDNGINRPTKINVHLYRKIKDATETAIDTGKVQTVTSETNWRYEFKDLPKYTTKGQEYEYSVKEDAVPGYESVISDDSQLISNYAFTEINGEKKWNDSDNQYLIRPKQIIVQLLRNNKVIDEQTVTPDKNGSWYYQFINLPMYDKKTNEKYQYTVQEKEVPENYVFSVVSENIKDGKTTIDILNTYRPNGVLPDTGGGLIKRLLIVTGFSIIMGSLCFASIFLYNKKKI